MNDVLWFFWKIELDARRVGAGDFDGLRRSESPFLGGGDPVSPRIENDGFGERRFPNKRVVDGNIRIRDVCRDFDTSDASAQFFDVSVDFGLSLRVDVGPALSEVLLERIERVCVIAQLELNVADVVEDVVVRRELVGAPEFDERRSIVAFVE